MKRMADIKIRLWVAVLITVILIAPAFVIGWTAGVHGGFHTGSTVTALEIRNALREGVHEKIDFFIKDLQGIRFRPMGAGEANFCIAVAEDKDPKNTRTVSLSPGND